MIPTAPEKTLVGSVIDFATNISKNTFASSECA